MNKSLKMLVRWCSRRLRLGSAMRCEYLPISAVVVCLVSASVHAQTPSDPDETDRDELEEIIVTGTSLRGEQPVGSDLITLGRTQIEGIGAPNTGDLLTKVPLINNFNSVVRPGLGGAVGPASPPGMRNLNSNATLVLLDGQRLIGANPLDTTADPSSIPPAAIERVEIVADGASAIYGSDAVAGVINIVLRKDLDGAETSIRKNWGEHGYDAIDLSQAFGKVWSTGSAMAVIGYNNNSNLSNTDLQYYTNDLRPYGGQDLRPINCDPPNVILDGVTYAPPGYEPGVASRCENGQRADSVSEYRRTSVIFNARQEITDKLNVFGHIKHTDTESTNNSAPGIANATLTTANPFFFRPAGATADSETVVMNVFPIVGQTVIEADSESSALLLGADYFLPRDFRLQASINYGLGKNGTHTPSFSAAALNAAAAGTTVDTALDPFEGRTSPAVAAAIADHRNDFRSEQEMYDYQAKVDGALFALPGGDVKVAFGLSHRKYVYEAENTVGSNSLDQPAAAVDADRTIKSVFGEVLLPLVGQGNAMPFVESLSVSAAVRYDDYSDFGDTSNPKFGLTWSPVEGLVLRGSVGSSFAAPDMGDSYAVDTRAIYFPNFPLVPPGAPPTDTIVLAGGNPGLQPEEADTYSFGVEINPTWLDGFRASVTYWNLEYGNLIKTGPISPEIFTNPAFADLYVLNPTQAQIDEIEANFRLEQTTAPIPNVGQIIDLRRANLGATNVDGIDYSLSYDWDSDMGSFTASVSGTETIDFDVQSAAGAPFLGQDNFIKSRWRADLSWFDGPISAGLAWNHSGEYDQTYNLAAGGTGVQSVDAFDTVDLRMSYEFGEWGLLEGTTLSLNVNNALDEDPPLLLGSGGYSNLASPLGRLIWVGIDIAW